jgi:5-methylcytosine-specific restriction protein A
LFASQRISLGEALDQLVGSLGMNQTSATNYMRIFVAFSEGKVYKRAMDIETLRQIIQDKALI